jgi:hypothetical protein
MNTHSPFSPRTTIRIEIVEPETPLSLTFKEALGDWSEGRAGKMQAALRSLCQKLSALHDDPLFVAPELADIVDQLAIECVCRRDLMLLGAVLALPHRGAKDNFYCATVLAAESAWKEGYNVLRLQNQAVELLCQHFTEGALYRAFQLDDPSTYCAPSEADQALKQVRSFVSAVRCSGDGTLDRALDFLEQVGLDWAFTEAAAL